MTKLFWSGGFILLCSLGVPCGHENSGANAGSPAQAVGGVLAAGHGPGWDEPSRMWQSTRSRGLRTLT